MITDAAPYALIGGLVLLGIAWAARRRWMGPRLGLMAHPIAAVASVLIVASAGAVLLSGEVSGPAKWRTFTAVLLVVAYWLRPQISRWRWKR